MWGAGAGAGAEGADLGQGRGGFGARVEAVTQAAGGNALPVAVALCLSTPVFLLVFASNDLKILC